MKVLPSFPICIRLSYPTGSLCPLEWVQLDHSKFGGAGPD